MFNLKDSKIDKLENKVWLSSPTMYADSMKYAIEAFETNWMSTVGANINEIERIGAEKVGAKYAVALSTRTASLHLALKLAGVKKGDKVFCTDMTFAATVNPVLYEGATPVFIDTEYDTWNMDPIALEKAFEIYPDVKIVVVVHLYGTPCKMDEILSIAQKHGAVVIEDAAESFGATYKGKQTGILGEIGCISFNGNKIITGSCGGMLFTNDLATADEVRKLSTQARENAPWYQHEEAGYNYRMSNVIAGIVRGQLERLDNHINQKKAIYERYKEAFKNLPVTMNPYDENNSQPNFWLSCLLLDNDAMCKQVREDCTVSYFPEQAKTCPTEILEKLAEFNIEGRPIWKPMHMQPIYKTNSFITREGEIKVQDNNALGSDGLPKDIGRDIFNRGLCLPSDNKMTIEQQDVIIQIIKACFN
jgi:dTDP-4-amino-4,6-dideoxygalactose transaminase